MFLYKVVSDIKKGIKAKKFAIEMVYLQARENMSCMCRVV